MHDEFKMPDREKLETICGCSDTPGKANFVGIQVNGLTIYEVDQKTPLTSLNNSEDVYVERWGFFKVNLEKVTLENPVIHSLIEWCDLRKCYAATCFLDVRRIRLVEF